MKGDRFDDNQEIKGNVSLKAEIEQRGVILILGLCSVVITMQTGRRRISGGACSADDFASSQRFVEDVEVQWWCN